MKGASVTDRKNMRYEAIVNCDAAPLFFPQIVHPEVSSKYQQGATSRTLYNEKEPLRHPKNHTFLRGK